MIDLENIRKKNHKKVLLYSGGMDSYIISKLEYYDVLLYIDSNSRYSRIERDFLEKQNLEKLVIDTRLDLRDVEYSSSLVPLRNLYFVSIATYYGDRIVLGATKFDRSSDKDLTFAKRMEELLNHIYKKSWWCEGRDIKVSLKYKQYTKRDLLKMYICRGLNPYDLAEKSFSCYTPIGSQPCLNCKSCTRKIIHLSEYMNVNEYYKTNFKELYKNKINEIEKNMDNPILSRGQEDRDTLELYRKYISKDG